jgi:hypothetical protein
MSRGYLVKRSNSRYYKQIIIPLRHVSKYCPLRNISGIFYLFIGTCTDRQKTNSAKIFWGFFADLEFCFLQWDVLKRSPSFELLLLLEKKNMIRVGWILWWNVSSTSQNPLASIRRARTTFSYSSRWNIFRRFEMKKKKWIYFFKIKTNFWILIEFLCRGIFVSDLSERLLNAPHKKNLL